MVNHGHRLELPTCFTNLYIGSFWLSVLKDLLRDLLAAKNGGNFERCLARDIASDGAFVVANLTGLADSPVTDVYLTWNETLRGVS